jgi:hypothetical protein
MMAGAISEHGRGRTLTIATLKVRYPKMPETDVEPEARCDRFAVAGVSC